MSALEGLDGDSIQRVLDYVFSRLSIAPHQRGTVWMGTTGEFFMQLALSTPR